jgi:hypothetical protein
MSPALSIGGRPPSAAATSLGEAGSGAFADQGALELRDRPEHVEHQHAPGLGGVDALGQRHQADAALLEVLPAGDQLFERPGKLVGLPYYQHVAPAQHVMEEARQFGPVRLCAGCLVGERLFTVRPPKRIELKLRRLVGRAHPGAADPHAFPTFSKTVEAVRFSERAIKNGFEKENVSPRVLGADRAGTRQKRWFTRTARLPVCSVREIPTNATYVDGGPKQRP